MNPTLAAWISTGWCVYVDIQTILGASAAGITLYESKIRGWMQEYPYYYLRPVDP